MVLWLTLAFLMLSCGSLPGPIAKNVEGVVWEKVFGTKTTLFSIGGFESGESVQQTSDGGYILVGPTIDKGYDIWLLKTDALGNKLWGKTFGGDFADHGRCAQQTSDGGYIVVGSTMFGTSWEDVYQRGGDQVWLVKTDVDGNEVWNKIFGGNHGGVGYFVQQTPDGGYILVGETDSYGAGSLDVWLIKTDADGNELWNKTFGGADTDTGNCVRQTMDGGYVLVGKTRSYGAGSSDVWLIKTDDNGNELWDLYFGGSSYDGGESLVQTADGSYVITGYTAHKISGLAGLGCAKMDSTTDKNLFLVKFARNY